MLKKSDRVLQTCSRGPRGLFLFKINWMHVK